MERSMDYCDVCGISHSMKYRHLYTKRHQQNALNACKKLHRKVSLPECICMNLRMFYLCSMYFIGSSISPDAFVALNK